MPQVTVYIRNDDMEKWRAVSQKTEFIHNALNPIVLKHRELGKGLRPEREVPIDILKQGAGGRYGGDSPIVDPLLEPTREPPEPIKVIKTVQEAVEAVETVKRCKGAHYMDRSDCGKPGCPWREE